MLGISIGISNSVAGRNTGADAAGPIVFDYADRVIADDGTVENVVCTTNFIKSLSP
jgi:hypothetical protein